MDKNSVQKNEAMMEMLGKYRLNMIANGVLETTGDQLVRKMTIMLSDMVDNFGVEFRDGKFYGLTGAVLQDWQAKLLVEGKKAATRQNYTVILNEFLRWGCGPSLFVDARTDVPLWTVLKTQVKKDAEEENAKPKMFTEEEIRQMINNMEGHANNMNRDKAIIATFVGSGIRAFSLCGMNIGDYRQQEHGYIRIKNKGGKMKNARLAEFAYEFIDRYLEERVDRDDMSAPLFMTQQKTRFNPNSLLKTIGRKQEKLGLTRGLHIFRHTFISAAEKEGGLAAARDLVFHKNANITNLYAHSTEEDLVNTVNNLPWNDLTTDE